MSEIKLKLKSIPPVPKFKSRSKQYMKRERLVYFIIGLEVGIILMLIAITTNQYYHWFNHCK